jgi:DNA-binding HxlR family transcriptional regulator
MDVVTTMRTYGDGCGIAHGLDLVGERWGLLVVRELLLGPKRFTDLKAGLPNASPNVLAQRLRELEQAAIVARRKLPPPAGSWVYELTDWGRELKPIVMSLGTWALRSPSFSGDAPVGTDSVVLALGTFFDADAAGDLVARYELRLGESVFCVAIADGAIEVDRNAVEAPDAIIATDPATLSALIWERRDLAGALRAGDVAIEGDQAAATRFLELFPPPRRLFSARGRQALR